MDHFENWKNLVNPEFYIRLGGFWLVIFIIFAETGLFVGFFLPGDSLLFISGIYSVEMVTNTFGTTGSGFGDTTIVAGSIALAAIIGNELGYWIGHKTGPAFYEKKDSFFFKKKYLYQATEFFEKHGSLAIIVARFLPIVRTFVPIVAGIVGMSKKRFLLDNVIGALLWSFSLVFAGHYLDRFFLDQFKIDLKAHLESIILVLVLVTTLPVILKLIFGKSKAPEQD
ncbi:DedA family protein [Bergeyella sp. RCAD1439]|uniref:DedA family protein n=1 Tax=Bergeyella anatis TaxID=3113737 RepID=UPI002E1949E9|nr:DedA family protein [Bergeyella sp. RCAD1439]